VIGIVTTTEESINPQKPSFDYSPCDYSDGNVVCDKVPLEEVQKAFKRTLFPMLLLVKLILQPGIISETVIPGDVFGTKRILQIMIEYPLDSCCDNKLQVDANTFLSTKSYTNNFTIGIIDCTLLDLGFLSGFEKLIHLNLWSIYKIHHCFPKLPPLPRLTSLHFEFCSGMNELNIFPTLTNGLQVVKFFGSEDKDKTYNDATVDRLIDWLLISSATTLEEMVIAKMNQVTRVPHQIKSLKALKTLWLHENKISIIKSGAFSFSVPVSVLGIIDNGIKEIEPGAFQGKHDHCKYVRHILILRIIKYIYQFLRSNITGDFKDAKVYVYNNNLTRFEESVFGSILQQMASGKGYILASFENGSKLSN